MAQSSESETKVLRLQWHSATAHAHGSNETDQNIKFLINFCHKWTIWTQFTINIESEIDYSYKILHLLVNNYTSMCKRFHHQV